MSRPHVRWLIVYVALIGGVLLMLGLVLGLNAALAGGGFIATVATVAEAVISSTAHAKPSERRPREYRPWFVLAAGAVVILAAGLVLSHIIASNKSVISAQTPSLTSTPTLASTSAAPIQTSTPSAVQTSTPTPTRSAVPSRSPRDTRTSGSNGGDGENQPVGCTQITGSADHSDIQIDIPQPHATPPSQYFPVSGTTSTAISDEESWFVECAPLAHQYQLPQGTPLLTGSGSWTHTVSTDGHDKYTYWMCVVLISKQGADALRQTYTSVPAGTAVWIDALPKGVRQHHCIPVDFPGPSAG